VTLSHEVVRFDDHLGECRPATSAAGDTIEVEVTMDAGWPLAFDASVVGAQAAKDAVAVVSFGRPGAVAAREPTVFAEGQTDSVETNCRYMRRDCRIRPVGFVVGDRAPN
jgi:hypothetical protein